MRLDQSNYLLKFRKDCVCAIAQVVFHKLSDRIGKSLITSEVPMRVKQF